MLAVFVQGFSPSPTDSPLLGLKIHPYGTFNVTLGGKPWLNGGEVRVGSYCSSCSGANTLERPKPPVTSKAADELGEYEATTFTWVGHSGGPMIETTFKHYADAIIFEQSFPKGVDLDAIGGTGGKSSDGARTLFPTFARNDGGPADALQCASYHGVFPRIEACTVPTYSESHQGGVPLLIYDPRDDRLPNTLFSPLSTPKAQHMATSKASLHGARVGSTGLARGRWRRWRCGHAPEAGIAS